MTFKKGDRIRYRSIAGELYDATILHVHEDRWCSGGSPVSVDLNIHVPGKREPFHTTRVPLDRCSHIPAYGPPFTTDVP